MWLFQELTDAQFDLRATVHGQCVNQQLVGLQQSLVWADARKAHWARPKALTTLRLLVTNYTTSVNKFFTVLHICICKIRRTILVCKCVENFLSISISRHFSADSQYIYLCTTEQARIPRPVVKAYDVFLAGSTILAVSGVGSVCLLTI